MLQSILAYSKPTFWLPQGSSSVSADVDWIYYFVYWVNVIFTFIVIALMVYFAIKYRHRKGVVQESTAGHSTALELTWTIIPTLIVIVIFYYGFKGFLALAVEPPNAYEITVNAKMWNWSFIYPNGYVSPDLHTGVPKPCMDGWGRRQLTVTPSGDVLPCPVANLLPGLPVENVRDRPLHAIWYESESFNQFRGTEWMSEPCRSCPRRDLDFGGCRCQAYQFTGDAAVTDPACRYSPHRPLVEAVLAGGERIARSGDAGAAPPAYRPHPPTT